MKIIVTSICCALCFVFTMAMTLSIAQGDATGGLWMFVIAFLFGYLAVHVGFAGDERERR